MQRVAITVSIVLRTVMKVPQAAEIAGSLDRDFLSSQGDQFKRGKQLAHLVELIFSIHALQDFGKDQIADPQRLGAQKRVEAIRLTVPLPRK